MKTCDVCALAFHGEKCPNAWRANKKDELTARGQGKHEAARASVERHRVAQAAVAAEAAATL